MANDRAAAPASERPLPPLPEPVGIAVNVLEGQTWNGEACIPSWDMHSSGFGWEAKWAELGLTQIPMFTADQMNAYVLADRAASAPQAVRMPLTEEQIASIHVDFSTTGDIGDSPRALLRKIVRHVEAAHGIVPLAPQDTGGRE